MRRSLERRVDDLMKNSNASTTGMRKPEPPPPPRGITEDEERERAEQTRKMLEQLGGRIGKLETRKLTHEERLQRELAASQREVEMLRAQVKAANALSMQRGLAAGISGARSARAGMEASAMRAKLSASLPGGTSPRGQLRPTSPRDALAREAVCRLRNRTHLAVVCSATRRPSLIVIATRPPVSARARWHLSGRRGAAEAGTSWQERRRRAQTHKGGARCATAATSRS